MGDIGDLGEALVVSWLKAQDYQLLHQNWHCRWGEIDIIALSKSTLIFVEVKTRSRNNWDELGLLSI